jgi:hypothetical protein
MDEEVNIIRIVQWRTITLVFLRLQGCQPEVETWQRVLQLRTLVSLPEDDTDMWIKFANLCRKSERMVLADKTINSLLLAVSTTLAFCVLSIDITIAIQQSVFQGLCSCKGSAQCSLCPTQVHVG